MPSQGHSGVVGLHNCRKFCEQWNSGGQVAVARLAPIAHADGKVARAAEAVIPGHLLRHTEDRRFEGAATSNVAHGAVAAAPAAGLTEVFLSLCSRRREPKIGLRLLSR